MDPLISEGVALITGSGSGIGQAIATGFARSGCTKIFLVDLSRDGLEATRKLITNENSDAKVSVHVADVSDDASVKNMVESCVKDFGRIDFACNNAGIAMQDNVTTEVSTETLDRVINVNLKGIYLCHHHEIPVMMKQTPLRASGSLRPNACRGSIVNTASMSGLAAMGGLSAYNASKHGVVSMTRVDARQFAKEGIRVNCVCPGFVPTPLAKSSGVTPEWMASAQSQAPMNRWVETSEIADGVLFLSSSAASAITGISLPIDGGALLFHIV